MAKRIRKATYMGIPCWYDMLTDELTGRNRFYDFLLDIALYFSLYVLRKDDIEFWVEVDELEKN